MSWKVEKEITITKKYDIQSVWERFMEYGKLKGHRNRTQQKTASTCALCNHSFKEDEFVHLAINYSKEGNVLLCDSCLDEAKQNNVPVSTK